MRIHSLLISALLASYSCGAKEFDIQGQTYLVIEVSPQEVMAKKLESMKADGSYEKLEKALQKKVQDALTHPHPLEGWTPTRESRSYSFDPTWTLPKDIKDPQGKVLFKKGTHVNPLEIFSIDRTLLMIDGRQANQVQWALKQHSENTRIVCVAGSPVDLMKATNQAIYFDQQSVILKRFKLLHIPAKIRIRDQKIIIDEISVDDVEMEI